MCWIRSLLLLIVLLPEVLVADPAHVATEDVIKYITAQAPTYGVDANHASAILLAENMGPNGAIPTTINTSKVSSAGASGVMQVMPATKASLVAQGHLDEEHSESGNWQSSVNAGLAALKEIQGRVKSKDPNLLAVEYNSGPKGGRLFQAGETNRLPSETINYLKKFSFAQNWLSKSGGGGRGFADGGTPNVRERGSYTTVAGIDAIRETLENNRQWTEEGIRMLTDSREEEAAEHQQAAMQAEKAGQEAGFAKQLEGTVLAASAESRKRILGILNLDTTNVDNAVAQMAASFQALDAERKQKELAINEKMAVGFFDNPLGYLINATQLPGMVEEHNALAKRQNDFTTTLKTMQGIADTQERIDVSASADQIAQLHMHQGNAIVAQANQQASQMRAQAASASARMATGVAALREGQLRAEISVAQLEKIVQGYNEGDENKRKLKEEEDQLDKDLRRIGALVGAPGMSLTVMKRMPKVEQDKWLQRVAANNIGSTPYDAIQFLTPGMLTNMRNTGSSALVETLGNIRKYLIASAQMEAQKAAATGGKPAPRDELMRSASETLKGELFAQSTNMLVGPDWSPYRINHGAMAKEWTGVDLRGDPNNIVYKTVKDSYTNGIRLNDAQLYGAIENLVLAGTLTPAQAAQQLADYYTAGIDRNNKVQSFELIGLDKQEDYNMRPKGTKFAINFTNPAALEQILTMKVVRSKTFIGDWELPKGFQLSP